MLFKEMSDQALRAEYRGNRELAYNNARIAQQGKASAGRMARQMGRLMANIRIIEAIARQRGIGLVVVQEPEEIEVIRERECS